MSAVVLFFGVSVDRSGNFVTMFFGQFGFNYFLPMGAIVLFFGVSVDRSSKFVTFFGILVLSISRQ